MKVRNIHTRKINASKSRIWQLVETLSSNHDMVIASPKWPKMVLDQGLKLGSNGGHGPIGYTIQELRHGEMIKFKFTKPRGFNGFHQFEIRKIENEQSEFRHTIEMETSFQAFILWVTAIRWLHDAFIEDAFDKVENHFTKAGKVSKWNFWVQFLRRILKPKRVRFSKVK